MAPTITKWQDFFLYIYLKWKVCSSDKTFKTSRQNVLCSYSVIIEVDTQSGFKYIAFQSFHIFKNFLWEHVPDPPPPQFYDPTVCHSCLMKVEQTPSSSSIENPVYMNFGTFLAQRHQTRIKRHIQNYSFLTTRKMLQSAGW